MDEDPGRPNPEQTGWRRRWRDWWPVTGWLLLGVAFLGLWVLGTLAFIEFDRINGTKRTWSDAVYRALVLFTMQGGDPEGEIPWSLELVRFLAPGVTLFSLYQAASAIFREQARCWNRSQARDIPHKLAAVGCHLVPTLNWEVPLYRLSGPEIDTPPGV